MNWASLLWYSCGYLQLKSQKSWLQLMNELVFVPQHDCVDLLYCLGGFIG